MPRPILFIHRKSDSNIGDQLSSPYLYFHDSYPTSLHLEIHRPKRNTLDKACRFLFGKIRDNAAAIIIGGGGLLDQEFFQGDIDFWCKSPAPKILWGAGHNSHNPAGLAPCLPDTGSYSQLTAFNHIGLRDWGQGFSWVPCASCMHEQLSQPIRTRGKGTLFLMHRDLRTNPSALDSILQYAGDDFSVAFNDEPAAVIFEKLRNSEKIVTNSFHGAYWATLMKKPVVGIGGGTKIGLLKHSIPLGHVQGWKSLIKKAVIHDHALEECRDINNSFNAIVSKACKDSRAKIYKSDPIDERSQDFSIASRPLPPVESGNVPKIVHFVFGLTPDFGGKPFNIMHYLAVRSIKEKLNPDAIFFHCKYEPDNEYYHRIRSFLTRIEVESPEFHNGKYIEHFAHRADIIRLQALHETGGIYLDLDTITVGDISQVLHHSFTIGLQGNNPTQGLCNAVMAASPNDPFVTDWLSYYDNFDPTRWDQYSVKLPYLLWRSGRHSINIEKYDRFHWPLWDNNGLRLMFEKDCEFPNAIIHHLWESKSFPRYFVNESFKSSVDRIKSMNCTYSRLAMPYL